MTTVAIQGIRGSYSEEAAAAHFGIDAEIIECSSFADTVEAVISRRAEFAVIPMRNSIVGEIAAAVDAVKREGLKRVGEIDLQVAHVLAGNANASVESISAVRSHAEALRQCTRFFSAYPHLSQIPGTDTASSVRMVIEDAMTREAAICSRRAAEIYGAKVIKYDVADRRDNRTTFAILTI